MIGFAANDAAESDIAGVARRRRKLSGLLGERNDRRNLQRTRNRDDVKPRATRLQRILGPFQQGVGQIIVEARLNDEDTGSFGQDGSSPSMVRQPTMFSP